MPLGQLKNRVYQLALPVLGKKSPIRGEGELEEILKKHHVQGCCIQCFDANGLGAVYCAGLARKGVKAGEDTVFRTASLAKTVTALLVFRLQTKGLLDVGEDLTRLWGEPITSPYAPGAPVTLGMLLSHTSRLRDSEAYFASFAHPLKAEELLGSEESWLPGIPGTGFCYSNFGGGLIGCILEKAFGESLETLFQRELFAPLGVEATFDLTKVPRERLGDSFRVLPPKKAFDGAARQSSAQPLTEADPQHHYLFTSGNLYLRSKDLARLIQTALTPGFLDERSLKQLRTPLLGWPDQRVKMRHGMGLFLLEDEQVLSRPVWGHQGFAYGAVNGVFFDEAGKGFAMLNSGAAESRIGHLSALNRDLLQLLMEEREP